MTFFGLGVEEVGAILQEAEEGNFGQQDVLNASWGSDS